MKYLKYILTLIILMLVINFANSADVYTQISNLRFRSLTNNLMCASFGTNETVCSPYWTDPYLNNLTVWYECEYEDAGHGRDLTNSAYTGGWATNVVGGGTNTPPYPRTLSMIAGTNYLGRVERCEFLDGYWGSQGFIVPNASLLNGQTSVTMSAWVKLYAYRAYAGILYSRGTTISSFSYYDADTKIIWNLSNYGGQYSSADNVNWYHMCLTWQVGEAVKFYYNGSTNGITQYTNIMNTCSQNALFYIGVDTYDAPTRNLRGWVDDIRIYTNKCLSESEVSTLYSKTHPTNNLVYRP